MAARRSRMRRRSASDAARASSSWPACALSRDASASKIANWGLRQRSALSGQPEHSAISDRRAPSRRATTLESTRFPQARTRPIRPACCCSEGRVCSTDTSRLKAASLTLASVPLMESSTISSPSLRISSDRPASCWRVREVSACNALARDSGSESLLAMRTSTGRQPAWMAALCSGGERSTKARITAAARHRSCDEVSLSSRSSAGRPPTAVTSRGASGACSAVSMSSSCAAASSASTMSSLSPKPPPSRAAPPAGRARPTSVLTAITEDEGSDGR
mmetsp:Transcript_7276/g.16619  ORF Transcript_7276/g.16619 Transcript_7276/m.16619 type:complete len:277 (-) Transcript_7276:10569-11399(-)